MTFVSGGDRNQVRLVTFDTLANRPAPGIFGRMYWTTDERILYRDTGAAWDKMAAADYANLDGIPQRGSDTTDGGGDATVTFPVEFAAPPLVFLQGVDAGAKGIVLDVVSKTTTQAVVKARKVTGITSGAGTAHSHSFSDSFNTSYISAGTPAGSIGNDDSSKETGFLIVTTEPLWASAHEGGENDDPFSAVINTSASHSFLYGNHIHVFSGNALDTHRHTGSVSGTTGNESAHTHGVAAPALAIDFDWLAVKV